MNSETDFYSLDQDNYLKFQLYYRQQQFSSYTNLTFQFITFNCGNKDLTPDFFKLLNPSKQLIVIGLQEFDTDMSSILTSNSKKSLIYQELLQKHLKPHIIFSKQLGSQLLFIATNIPSFASVDFQSVSTGILGKVANKGGILARIQIKDCSFLVVSCHLSASRDADGPTLRTRDLIKILQNYISTNKKTICSEFQQKIPENQRSLDAIFVLGDMNFRVETDETPSKIAEKLSEKEFYVKFKEGDQLIKGMEQWNKVSELSGFVEEKFDFLPSYCFLVAEDGEVLDNQYAVVEGGKVRTPAFTDRICMKMINQDIKIDILKYDQFREYQVSDHRAVWQEGVIGVREYQQADMQKTMKAIRSDFVDLVNSLKPQFDAKVEIDKIEYIIGESNVVSISVRNRHVSQKLILDIEIGSEFIYVENKQIDIRPDCCQTFDFKIFLNPLNSQFQSFEDYLDMFMSTSQVECQIKLTHRLQQEIIAKQIIPFYIDLQKVAINNIESYYQNVSTDEIMHKLNQYIQIYGQYSVLFSDQQSLKNQSYNIYLQAQSEKMTFQQLLFSIEKKFQFEQSQQIKNGQLQISGNTYSNFTILKDIVQQIQYKPFANIVQCLLSQISITELKTLQNMNIRSYFNLYEPKVLIDYLMLYLCKFKFQLRKPLLEVCSQFHQIQQENKNLSRETTKQIAICLLDQLAFQEKFIIIDLFILNNQLPVIMQLLQRLMSQDIYRVLEFIYTSIKAARQNISGVVQ